MDGGVPPAGTAPYRPVAGPPLALPAAFGTRFFVCVDTEEEFDWNAPFSRDRHGTTATAAIPSAHRRFADRGVALTYLVDYPIVADPASVSRIAQALSDGRSTVGTQLHPWVNPPFEEEVNAANSFAGNLPPALERAKLATLTERIEHAFGIRPRIYRAGRYGVGPATWNLLAELGYRFDTSLRAGYDYAPGGGPDFTAIGNRPFLTSAGPIELPLTTVFTGRVRNPTLYHAAGRIPRGRGVLARAGLVQRVALTPEEMPLRDVQEAIRVGHGDGLPLLNFSFHSPTLAPGHTPYVRDATELAQFWAWWDGVLDLLDRLGIANASLAEIDAAVGPAGLEPATKPL